MDRESNGANPQVFEYKIVDDRLKGYVFLMKFYGAISIAVALVTKNNEYGYSVPNV
jgi:hypothetical protein